MKRCALSAALVLLFLALRAASASAVPLYLGLEGGTVVVGEVTLVDIVSGLPAGAVVHPTVGDPPYPEWWGSVVFQVTMTGTQTLASIGLFYFTHDDYAVSVGGWVPGASEPDGLVDGSPTPFQPGLNGSEFPGGVGPGQTTNEVFVVVDLRELPQQIQLQGELTPSGFVNANLPIPEPGSAASLAFGLGLLGALRARRRAAANVALAA